MRRAASLFTIVPVGAYLDLTRADARRAVAWLPWLGLVIGVVTGVSAGLIAWWRPGAGLLAAALAVGSWVLVTGAMHLDGLADTCDGLASRRPADEALAIMKKSDTGPVGVAAVVLALLIDVAAAGSLRDPVALAVALTLAPMVGRAATLGATMPGIPAARSSGFGALFAGVTPGASGFGGLGAVVAVVGMVAAAGVAGGGIVRAWGAASFGWLGFDGIVAAVVGLVAAAVAALGVAAWWGRALAARFGGITGDLIGAQIELAQAVFLVGAALALG